MTDGREERFFVCPERSIPACSPEVALRDATTARGHNDTSSQPAKDLGGTLWRTMKSTLRSYDSRASGDQKCLLFQRYPIITRSYFKIRYHALVASVTSAFM